MVFVLKSCTVSMVVMNAIYGVLMIGKGVQELMRRTIKQ